MYSGLSTEAFIKKPTVQRLTRDGLKELSKTSVLIAEYEGFFAHANSFKTRLRDDQMDFERVDMREMTEEEMTKAGEMAEIVFIYEEISNLVDLNLSEIFLSSFKSDLFNTIIDVK